MPLIIVEKKFAFAHRGVEVEQFEASEAPRETTDEVAAWVQAHGYGRLAPAAPSEPPAAPVEQQAAPAAPENKDAAPQREAPAKKGR